MKFRSCMSGEMALSDVPEARLVSKNSASLVFCGATPVGSVRAPTLGRNMFDSKLLERKFIDVMLLSVYENDWYGLVAGRDISEAWPITDLATLGCGELDILNEGDDCRAWAILLDEYAVLRGCHDAERNVEGGGISVVECLRAASICSCGVIVSTALSGESEISSCSELSRISSCSTAPDPSGSRFALWSALFESPAARFSSSHQASDLRTLALCLQIEFSSLLTF